MHKILADSIFPKNTNFHVMFHSSFTMISKSHSHDFFEFFIITSGSVKHFVNSRIQNLEKGAFVFIRPEDKHYFLPSSKKDCSFINIAVHKNLIFAMRRYIGEDFSWDKIFLSHLPPIAILSISDLSQLEEKLHSLNFMPGGNFSKKEYIIRGILAEIFSRNFIDFNKNISSNAPLWFEAILKKAQKKEVFCEGVSRLVRLSNHSHEHLCRMFRKHLKKSPTKYINEQKINYAANLLLNTDMKIIDISLECGFSNLSHFNHTFKKAHNLSPSKYRQAYCKSSYI